ncbi:hypothetical protein DICVIV_01123 [Dictyocaulus viviparus]|uniref:Shavenoid isoform B-like N-terminal domain-containing protein n=1 Tax=Dictyocaulus viviparus TaxID=29172 RepID=A0A0D8Y8W7_DICVI|nr:hypothetical protein DICVIV_01123 [Dictyocaulus viviparus]
MLIVLEGLQKPLLNPTDVVWFIIITTVISERCSCVCPPMAPIYLNTAGQCVDRLDECRHNLEFDSTIETERIIPVVSLPAKSGVILPRAPILWEGGGITVSPRRTVDCAISAMFVDNLEHRWKEVPHQTFDLSVANGRPVLMATALREAENMGTCEFGTLVERIPKRRLYFSTEYLEKEMMENPPPVAEQFLADLRRVIEIARERIKMRRFVPMLITIPEDLEESRNTVIQRTDAYDAADTNQQESPKSNKSVDSGRESRSDSDDSGRDDEEELRTKNWSEDRKCPDETNTICSAVGGLESNTAVQALELEQPSRVHSKIVPKSTRLPVSKMHTPLGRASPRPRQKSLTLQLSSPFGSDLPHRTPRELRARRGYAVFPADPILNKSLPRRKRAIPQFLGSSAASG